MYDAVTVNYQGRRELKTFSSDQVLRVLSKRYLKIIDEKQNFKISTMLPGGKWILCKFDYLRLIIFENEVAIFKSKYNSNQSAIDKFVEQLGNRISEEHRHDLPPQTPCCAKRAMLNSKSLLSGLSKSAFIPVQEPSFTRNLQTKHADPTIKKQASIDTSVLQLVPPTRAIPLENRSIQATVDDCSCFTTENLQNGVSAEGDVHELVPVVLPFSYLVLETVFKHIDEYYDGRVEEVRPEIASVMNGLNESNSDFLTKSRLTSLKHRFLNLEFKIKDIDELFKNILDWEQDEIAEFNISGIPQLNQKYIDLIEGYGKYLEETRDEIEKMGKTLEFSMRIIDTTIMMIRNKYAKYDIHLQIITMALTGGTFISSLFGMNLKSHLEDNDFTFYLLTFIILVVCLAIFIATRCIFFSSIK